jgi:hypothetical protein
LKGSGDHAHSPHHQEITIAQYNLHTLQNKFRNYQPLNCELNASLVVADSEEPFTFTPGLSKEALQSSYDAVSWPGNSATIPFLPIEITKSFHPSLFYEMKQPGQMLMKSLYLANSNCGENTKTVSSEYSRDRIIQRLRQLGLVIDGYGKCSHSDPSDAIPINWDVIYTPEAQFKVTYISTSSTSTNINDVTKVKFRHQRRNLMNYYYFDITFEDLIQPGYITERIFDAWMAGTVPIYLGDNQLVKSLMPDPKAAIFYSDFQNEQGLVDYIQYLLDNETAYESHRTWRNTFKFEEYLMNRPLLKDSWYCRICQWAVKHSHKTYKRTKACQKTTTNHVQVSKTTISSKTHFTG